MSLGQTPKSASAAPGDHSNAPIKPESQSFLSKIIAGFALFADCLRP